MPYQHPRQSRRGSPAVCTSLLMTTVLLTASNPLAAQQSSQDGEDRAKPSPVEIRQELREVQTRIQTAQRDAARLPEVQEKRDVHLEALESAMIEKDPEAEKLLERREDLASSLRDSGELQQPPQERGEETNRMLQDYQQVNSRLQAAAEQVSGNEAVQEAYEAYQEIMLAEMKEVEPEVMDLIERQRELIRQFRQAQPPGE